MGAGDSSSRLGSYDHYPPEVERLPTVGALLDPNIERILTLKPGSGRRLRHPDRAAATGSIAPTFPTSPTRTEACPTSARPIRSLGARVGVGAAGAARLASSDRIRRRRDPQRRRQAGRDRRRCSSSAVSAARCATSTRAAACGFLHDMLEAAGGTDVLDRHRPAVGHDDDRDGARACAGGDPRAALRAA